MNEESPARIGVESPFRTLSTHLDLVRSLALKDFKVRYRNSGLGFLWSLFNPLAMMLILTVFYTFVFPSTISNYPVFALSGLLTWRYLAIGTSWSMDSISGNSSLVTKVFFPRWLLVLSNNLANTLGALLEFAALIPVMLVLGLKPSPYMVLLPFILFLEFILIFGISLILSSLSVYSRDFNQIWEISLQALFFLSPVFYSETIIPPRYALLYSLNPVERVLVAMRSVLYYGTLPSAADILGLALSGLVILLLGIVVFRRLEPRFGELV